MPVNIQGERVIDLSQTLEPGIPRPVGFPDFSLELFRKISDGAVVNVEALTFSPHSGTHIDAPVHFFEGGDTVDRMPPDIILGPAAVVDLRHLKGSVPIERTHVEAWEEKTGESIRPDDAVLLMTGFSQLWKTGPEGESFLTGGWPYISRSVADYFVERKIRLVGVESMDLDLIDPFDLSTSEFIGHRTFLPNGIYIVENLTNLDQIGAPRCQLIATPLKIKGGTGSPVRVLAVV